MKLSLITLAFALTACAGVPKSRLEFSASAVDYMARLDACIDKAAASTGKYEEYSKCADAVDTEFNIPHNGSAR